MKTLSTWTNDTRDLETLIADGLDSEARIPYSGPLFRSDCGPVLTAGDLETLIANALDAEFGL